MGHSTLPRSQPVELQHRPAHDRICAPTPLKNAPGRLATALAWFTTIYSALAVVLSLATQSSSERAVFAPTTIILFALVVTTMVGSRRRTRQASGT